MTIIFRILLVCVAVAVVVVWVDRYYLLPTNGIEVRVCCIHEHSTYRITGDQSDYDTLSQGDPSECTVMVMTLDEKQTFTVELDDMQFFRDLKVGEVCIGIQTGPGNVE